MPILYTIELDVNGEYDHEAETQKLCEKYGVTGVLLQEVGPAGGNPLYRFVGEREKLIAMIRECFHAGEPGDDHTQFLIDEHLVLQVFH